MQHFSDRIYWMKQHCTVHDLLLASTTKPKRHRTCILASAAYYAPSVFRDSLHTCHTLVLVRAYDRNC